MLAALTPALRALAFFTLLTGVLYPLAVTGLAHLLFPWQATGSPLVRDGRIVGSALIGQASDDPADFWGRPSATAKHPYNAAASVGSNLGPLHPQLDAAVRARIAVLRAADPGARGPVPADLVTASASGLDPHISPEAAEFQVPRVARARGLSESDVRALVSRHTAGRQFGLLGEPRVHVLALNLELDTLAPRH